MSDHDEKILKLIFDACGNGDIEFVQKHRQEISNNIDCQFFFEQWTFLHKAASTGNENIAEYLLDNNSSVHIKDERGGLALHRAAWSGHDEIVRILLDRGSASLIDERTKSGSTPLHLACYRGHSNVAKVLLRYGASLTIRDNTDDTVFDAATFLGFPFIVDMLNKEHQKRQMAFDAYNIESLQSTETNQINK